MERSPTAPPGANKAAIKVFDFTDPAHTRTWLRAMRDSTDDLAALAREGSCRTRSRVLARGEIRRRTREVARSIDGLLAEAEAAFAPPVEPVP
jgi:hypothetical protein